MKKSLADIIICSGVFVVLLVFAFQFGAIPKEARGYPLFMFAASGAVTLVLFVGALRGYQKEAEVANKSAFFSLAKTIAVYVVMMGGYIFLIDKIGYILSTLLFTGGSLLFLKVKSKKLLLILPVGLTFAVYFAFTQLLMVTLPKGTWLALLL